MKNHAIILTDDELATIRSCLIREKMREDRAIARGEHLGVRLARIVSVLAKLPDPE